MCNLYNLKASARDIGAVFHALDASGRALEKDYVSPGRPGLVVAGSAAARQLRAFDGVFGKEFADEGVSGAVLAANRPGFGALLSYVREGDQICVYSIDRLGRDALDVQSVIRKLLDKGVTVDVRGLGPIGRGGRRACSSCAGPDGRHGAAENQGAL